jgi:hypothetical protein
MGTETPLNHFDPTLQYLLKSLKLKIILRKNDPLLFQINFAKLFYIMRLNQESLKYRAEILKYLGIVLCVPVGTSILLLLTNINYIFPFRLFTISLPLALLGVQCIYRGMHILDKYWLEIKDL